MKLSAVLLAAAALGVVATPGHAFNPNAVLASGQYTIGIAGFVPVICRTSVSSSAVAPVAGTVQLGTLSNFCNSPNGYRVYADYSSTLANAKMIVDGKTVVLQKDGSTVVTESNRASIDSHSLALDLARNQPASGSISFRIEPL